MKTQTKHTATPWKYLDQGIISDNFNQWGNFCILEMPKGRDENHLAIAENEANARHIVKCVNSHNELVEACNNIEKIAIGFDTSNLNTHQRNSIALIYQNCMNVKQSLAKAESEE